MKVIYRLLSFLYLVKTRKVNQNTKDRKIQQLAKERYKIWMNDLMIEIIYLIIKSILV